jgi:hypothetical protein
MSAFDFSKHPRTSPAATSVVFALDQVYTHSGSSKFSFDLISGVAKALDVRPEIIVTAQIGEQLFARPGIVVVAIALTLDGHLLQRYKQNKSILTIGYSDYFFNGNNAHLCDVYLNPCFSPLFPEQIDKARQAGTVIIDYTYAPSRIRSRAIDRAAENRMGGPKTVAIYFREPDDVSVRSRLISATQILSEQREYKFLVSTGYGTVTETADILEDHFSKLPGSEFCNYNKNEREQNQRQLEGFLARADATAVTYDTLSGLSDMANTLMPVYLLASRNVAGRLWQKSTKERKDEKWREEYALQLELFKRGRLKVFSRKTITANWTPVCRDDWKIINGQIAGIIENRIRENASQPTF